MGILNWRVHYKTYSKLYNQWENEVYRLQEAAERFSYGQHIDIRDEQTFNRVKFFYINLKDIIKITPVTAFKNTTEVSEAYYNFIQQKNIIDSLFHEMNYHYEQLPGFLKQPRGF